MCKITLEYNQSSALAHRKLAALKATELLLKVEETPEPTLEQVQAHLQLREAALVRQDNGSDKIHTEYSHVFSSTQRYRDTEKS